MRKFLAIIAVVVVTLVCLSPLVSAGGYGVPTAAPPACATCPQQAPVIPQASISYVPRTVQYEDTVYEQQVVTVPRTVLRSQTVYEPQLSYSIPQAAPVNGCYNRALAPVRTVRAPSYGCVGRSFAPVRQRAPGCYGASAGFSGGFVAGGGAVAQNARGQFSAGGGGDIAISQRNQTVVAPAGSRVTTRSGGLRGVFAGQVTRVR